MVAKTPWEGEYNMEVIVELTKGTCRREEGKETILRGLRASSSETDSKLMECKMKVPAAT